VSLGCGLDARPWRLDLPADLRWIEADLLDMLEIQSGADGFRGAATAGFSSAIVLGAALAAAAEPASRVVRIQPAEVLRAE
jgi:hypothetical protein